MGLNEQQELAVITKEGPLLILAGAGSGKTTVLTHRITNILSDKDVESENILAVTFTNKAAEEMRERISHAVGPERSRGIWMMTFHSMCSKILRQEAEATGVIKSNFSIYDTGDARSVIRRAIAACGIDVRNLAPTAAQYMISMMKNEMIDLKSYLEDAPSNPYIDWKKAKSVIESKIPLEKRKEIGNVYQAYQRILSESNAVDFDDLILTTIQLLIGKPDILEKYCNQFHYIMVDEYQDTNHAQYVLVKLLAQKHRNIAVVGDDFQSIYAFRGSDIRNILEFEKDYPEATVIKLEENYRCTPYILQAANEVIAKNKSQREKKLYTKKLTGEKIGYYFAANDRDEARYVTNEILNRIKEGLSYKDFAILVRANLQSKPFEEALMRAGIPYQLFGGQKFYERQEIKDILSYLQFIENPNDAVSFARIMASFKGAVDEVAVEKMLEETSGKELWAIIKNPDMLSISESVKKKLTTFVSLIEEYRERKKTEKVGMILSKLILDCGYIQALRESSDDKADEKIEAIAEFLNVALNFENESSKGTIPAFLEHVSLHSTVDEQTDGNAVRMMTIHSAKGLEFPVVFLTGMEEGVFPHRKSATAVNIEEERRLCYVGITRAKEKLFMTHAKNRKMWGKEEEHDPSRFLYEFDHDLFDPKTPMLFVG